MRGRNDYQLIRHITNVLTASALLLRVTALTDLFHGLHGRLAPDRVLEHRLNDPVDGVIAV